MLSFRCFFFLMIRRPPRSTRLTHPFPTRRSSDLPARELQIGRIAVGRDRGLQQVHQLRRIGVRLAPRALAIETADRQGGDAPVERRLMLRSEEHTSELQSLMRISYAVFCLKKKNI